MWSSLKMAQSHLKYCKGWSWGKHLLNWFPAGADRPSHKVNPCCHIQLAESSDPSRWSNSPRHGWINGHRRKLEPPYDCLIPENSTPIIIKGIRKSLLIVVKEFQFPSSLFAINTRICAAACIRIALKHHVYALKSFFWIKRKKP